MHQVVSTNAAAQEENRAWRRFTGWFVGVFAGALAVIYLFVVLLDPYDAVSFSLPMERRIVSISQRYMYPQIARSGRFDAVILGTSTARLIDPEILNPVFGLRFANLAMNSMTAWEQQQMLDLLMREGKPPRALIVGLDRVWCDADADRNRTIPAGFPDWLYDESRWNNLLYLLNSGTLEIATRLFFHKLGLYRERVRYDGFEVFVPPEENYDAARARRHIWDETATITGAPTSPAAQPDAGDAPLRFPALAWLDAMLAGMPPDSEKILAFMPVHVAAQPKPGSPEAMVEAACKAQIEEIARARGAILADWRIPSAVTARDDNYWDRLHYRLPVAQRIARDLAGPVRAGIEAPDGAYRILAGRP